MNATDGTESEGADQTNAVEYSSTDYSDTLLVGDSVMSFASGVLEETLPNSTVDAVAGRSAEIGGDTEGLTEDHGVFDQLRNADTSTYRRYVISLGNNDWEGVYYDDLKPVVDQLLDSRDDARVVLVTMMVTNNETSTANTNEAMQRIASEDDRVKIADWYTVAAMSPELISDNCHPTYYETSDDGCSTYAAIIKAALDS